MFANNDFMVIIEEVRKPFDKLFESLNDIHEKLGNYILESFFLMNF